MERRAALAIGISLLILYVYQVFVVPPQPVTPPGPDKPAAAVSAETTPDNAPSSAPVEAAPPQSSIATVTAAAAERTLLVDNGRVEVVLSNRGGRILNWRLKGYLDDRGELVDLIPANLPSNVARPLSLKLADGALSDRANRALYRVSGDDGSDRIDATRDAKTLIFEYEDSAGLRVRKELRFEPQSYIFTIGTDVANNGSPIVPTIQWGPGLGDVGVTSAGGSFFTGNYVQPPSAIYERDGDVTRLTADGIKEQRVHDGAFVFSGVDDHYFLAAALEPGNARVEYDTVTVTGDGGTSRTFVSQSLTLNGDQRSLRMFVGPKQLETLRAAGAGGALARAINFGIFTWLVLPLLQALKWIYGFIGNYGWAIVLLTVFINLAMFPLRHKSLVSMRKMQALQPQIKAIQDRYSDLKMTDPARQKMNTEIMNLYREKGANPASGCVPMLLTMPVLLAFYSMLSQAIELRGADFAFWIHDLSVKDPFYVTPILMGVTMFWQQWVTPSTADPAQQRMMMFMPLVLTGVFLSLPSGLAVYYLVSNLCQIGQQYLTNRMIGPPAAALGSRAAADGRLKSAGSGKSAGAAGMKQGERKA